MLIPDTGCCPDVVDPFVVEPLVVFPLVLPAVVDTGDAEELFFPPPALCMQETVKVKSNGRMNLI